MARVLRAFIHAGLAFAAAAACARAGAHAGDPPQPAVDAADVAAREQQVFVAALRPRGTGRPVIAVAALNEGTETTDLLLPHAVLERAGVADVRVVAERPGAVSLYPALQVQAEQDFAAFDREHPRGADYVIVPAMKTDDDPAVTAWLQRQAGLGARIFSVCAGALVLGRAGLLDGRRYVSHWYYLDRLRERHPGATYVPDQRYVADRGVATTTGITASVPAMLALVEAIGGRDKAQAVAGELGVAGWSPAHDSSRFGLNAWRRVDFLLNKARFWDHQRWQVDVYDGTDDVALALAADAWSRTGRVSVQAAAAAPVTLRSGLVLAVQPVDPQRPRMPLDAGLAPVQQLDRTLCEVAGRFGAARRDWLMQELEYPGPVARCPG